jgi:hypothetical protein
MRSLSATAKKRRFSATGLAAPSDTHSEITPELYDPLGLKSRMRLTINSGSTRLKRIVLFWVAGKTSTKEIGTPLSISRNRTFG